MVEHAAVGFGGRVVELVDEHVVEVRRIERLEVLILGECLDRGEQHVCVWIFLGAVVEAQARGRAYLPEGLERLGQDLFAVGDEEDAAKRLGVERAHVGLAEPGGEDDEAGALAELARLLEHATGLALPPTTAFANAGMRELCLTSPVRREKVKTRSGSIIPCALRCSASPP